MEDGTPTVLGKPDPYYPGQQCGNCYFYKKLDETKRRGCTNPASPWEGHYRGELEGTLCVDYSPPSFHGKLNFKEIP